MRVLAYTSPARGHLNPMMGPLLELRRRGAEVHVGPSPRRSRRSARPGSSASRSTRRSRRSRTATTAPATRSRPACARSQTFAARAPLDRADFEAALDATEPDLALVDVTTLGAKAVAERRGLRWAESRPFLLEDPAPGVPPFGLGLRPMGGLVGRVRDAALGLVGRGFDRKARLPALNAGRKAAGLPPLAPATSATGPR